MINIGAKVQLEGEGLTDLKKNIEDELAPVETLEFTSGGSLLSSVRSSVRTGMMSGTSGLRDRLKGFVDQIGGGVLGGAAGSALPGRLGPPGAAAGATRGASEGASGLVGGVGDALKANPITATLGVIAGGVTALVRNTGPLGSILDLFSTALNIALIPLNRAVSRVILPFAKTAMRTAQNFNSKLRGEGLTTMLGSTAQAALDVIGSGIDWLVTNIGMKIWNAIPNPIRTGILSIVDFIQTLVDIGQGIIDTVTDFIDDPMGTIKNLAEDVIDFLAKNGQKIAEAMTKIPILGDILSAIKSITDPIGNAFAPPSDSILGEATGSFVGGIGDAIGFAEGGVVNGPTPAVVGEAGPEAIVPLDRFSEVIEVDVGVSLDATDVEGKLDEILIVLKDLRDQSDDDFGPTPRRDRAKKF